MFIADVHILHTFLTFFLYLCLSASINKCIAEMYGLYYACIYMGIDIFVDGVCNYVVIKLYYVKHIVY